MVKITPFILIILIVSSCKTQELYISVIEPAPVTIPSYIKSVGVIDRSLPSENTKQIDAIDKVISFEGKDLDLAISWAQKAYEDYKNRLALRYIDILEYRKTSNRILQNQEQ
jgi:hypothetical protein